MADWTSEVEAMIVNHHKVTSSRPDCPSLVEAFRRADWIDVTYELRRFGVPLPIVAAVRRKWPDTGFHRRLVQLTVNRFWKHPLTPLPVVKW
jgi:hypothetical protein